MTTSNVPNNPAPQPAPDVSGFMAAPIPVPVEVERQGAIEAAAVSPPLVAPPGIVPLETPVSQPHIEQPIPIQPGIDQPVVPQPAPVAQPAPEVTPVVAPQPDLQQQLQTQADQIAALQANETAVEQQRQENDVLQQQAQLQQLDAGAKQYGMQQYNKYLSEGTSDAKAREWATNDYNLISQAYGASLQTQQVNTKAQVVAKQYGINAQDLQSIDPNSMDAYGRLLQRLHHVEAGTKVVTQQVVAQQTFDSNLGAASGNAAEQFIKDLGDHTKVANPQSLAAWDQYMKQNLRNY